MADTITADTYLSVNFGFADGDTRQLKVPNPKDDLRGSHIKTVSDTLLSNKLIVGDKAGAEFAGILTADTYDVTATKFDI